MSPEQAEGKPSDTHSDIYSLGLVMYEMFTGQQAFRGDTAVCLLHQHGLKRRYYVRLVGRWIAVLSTGTIHPPDITEDGLPTGSPGDGPKFRNRRTAGPGQNGQ